MPSESKESLLAFRLGADGKFKTIGDCNNERDLRALLHYAQERIAAMNQNLAEISASSFSFEAIAPIGRIAQ
jgi:hypothetical protein